MLEIKSTESICQQYFFIGNDNISVLTYKLAKNMLQYQKWVMKSLSIFNEYSLSSLLRHLIGKSLTKNIQAFVSSSLLWFPLLFLIFMVISYKVNKIYNKSVSIWIIITQHSVLYTFEYFASIIMLPLLNYCAKTCQVSIFFIEYELI